MENFLYIYKYDPKYIKKYQINDVQILIKNYLKKDMDCIEINNIDNDTVKKYNVICIDFMAIFPATNDNSKLDHYMNIIKNGKHIALMTRDLHDYTFNFTKKNIGYDNLKIFLNNYNINYIISIYDCEELDYIKKYTNVKIYILPLHIDTTIFKNLNLKKCIDILIYGAIFPDAYPLRNRITNIVKTMNIKYHHVEYVNSSYNAKTWGPGLSELINRSWLTLCTCSRYNYLVLKYFEASACGSVVVGNMCRQGEEIWKDNYINIPNDATDDEIKNIIITALKNKERLKEISDIMYKKIHEEYNYQQFAIKLNNICYDINENSIDISIKNNF